MFAFAKRQRALAEIERRRGEEKTYTTPLPREASDLKAFLTDFYRNIIFKRQEDMKAELIKYPNTVNQFYTALVPKEIAYEDFWQRYYYRTASVERVISELEAQDEAKRKHAAEAILKKKQEFMQQWSSATQNVQTFVGDKLATSSASSSSAERGGDSSTANKRSASWSPKKSEEADAVKEPEKELEDTVTFLGDFSEDSSSESGAAVTTKQQPNEQEPGWDSTWTPPPPPPPESEPARKLTTESSSTDSTDTETAGGASAANVGFVDWPIDDDDMFSKNVETSTTTKKTGSTSANESVSSTSVSTTGTAASNKPVKVVPQIQSGGGEQVANTVKSYVGRVWDHTDPPDDAAEGVTTSKNASASTTAPSVLMSPKRRDKDKVANIRDSVTKGELAIKASPKPAVKKEVDEPNKLATAPQLPEITNCENEAESTAQAGTTGLFRGLFATPTTESKEENVAEKKTASVDASRKKTPLGRRERYWLLQHLKMTENQQTSASTARKAAVDLLAVDFGRSGKHRPFAKKNRQAAAPYRQRRNSGRNESKRLIMTL